MQDGDVPLEYVPLREWPQLARRLRLYVVKDDDRLKREANKAISYIRENAPDKLVRCLRQFLFEALHAATGRPVTEETRKELEEIGTMVDRTQDLRAAGKYRPIDLRTWKTSDLKQLLLLAIKEVGRKQSITYESVAAYLQREFEFMPILTGETLRKAISHHGLNWKEIKNRKTR